MLEELASNTLIRWAVWSAVVLGLTLLLWVLLSLPAYLLESFVRRVRKDIGDFTDGFVRSYLASRGDLNAGVHQRFSLFFRTYSFRHICDGNRALWDVTVRRLLEPIEQTSGRLHETIRHLSGSAAAAERVVDQLAKLESRFPRLPALPDARGLDSELKAVRRARRTLSISAFLLVALVVVNTFMLGQILREVADVGAVAVVGQLRLFHVLALLLALLEPTAGAIGAHYSLRDREAGRTSYAPQFVTGIVAVLLALMEGVFYAQVGRGDNPILLPFLGVPLGIEQAFFIMGFILPLLLAALGHIAYVSYMTVSDGSALRELHRRLKACAVTSDGLRHAFANADGELRRAKELGLEARRALEPLAGDQQTGLLAILDVAKAGLQTLGATRPAWATPHVGELTEAETRQQAFRIAAEAGLLVIAFTLAVWLQAAAIAALYPTLGTALPPLIAGGQAIVLAVAGLILRPAALVIDSGSVARPVEGGAPTVTHVAALLLCAGVFAINAYFLVHDALPGGRGLSWALSSAIGVGLVLLGRDLPSMLAMIWSCLSAGTIVAARILRMISVLVLRLLIGLFLILEFLLGLLALPVHAFRGTPS